jgi:hypothetical protein
MRLAIAVRVWRSRRRVVGSSRLAKASGVLVLSVQWPRPPITPQRLHIVDGLSIYLLLLSGAYTLV